jgi:hypothetical protein
VLNFSAWLAAGALAGAAAAAGTPAPLVPIAQSAQLTLEGSTAPAGLTLRLRATVPGAALSVTEVSVSLDGVSTSARRQADGSWFVPLSAARTANDGSLEVFVAHDGIREVLSGRIAPPPAASSGGSSGSSGGSGSGVVHEHKQLAWWILNIAVVLIAAIAISRRMS